MDGRTRAKKEMREELMGMEKKGQRAGTKEGIA